MPTTQKATRVGVTTTSFDERMSNIECHTNDVNGTGACSEGVASGRCPVDQQRRPGRHPATAEQRQKRLGWSKEDNKQRPAYRGNIGGRLQIPWHLTVGPDSPHQDER